MQVKLLNSSASKGGFAYVDRRTQQNLLLSPLPKLREHFGRRLRGRYTTNSIEPNGHSRPPYPVKSTSEVAASSTPYPRCAAQTPRVAIRPSSVEPLQGRILVVFAAPAQESHHADHYLRKRISLDRLIIFQRRNVVDRTTFALILHER